MTKKLKKDEKTPNPGTERAREVGCTCPVIDNEYGRGYMGQEGIFVYNMDCPIHKKLIEKED